MMPRHWLPFAIVSQHRHVEDLRDIAETRDLVGSRTAGRELAICVPERFFDGEEALALDEGAFDLAVVYCGVD
jgi:hypothetical protein